MKEIRILIGGMGNAARPMVDLLTSERERMENVYGLHFRIVGAVDSRGGVIAPNGISSVTLSEAKNRGTLADIPGLGITVLTASAVCISGTIGWIGLVIPHFGRMLVGPDNRKLIPVSALLGAAFLLLIDTAARNITSAELPLSILTGLIGAPFYFYLLVKQRMKLS